MFLCGIKLVNMTIDVWMKDRCAEIVTYYINHRNWYNLYGHRCDVKKLVNVSKMGHRPHPSRLHHQARPVNVTFYYLHLHNWSSRLTIVLPNKTCSFKILLSGINYKTDINLEQGTIAACEHLRQLLLRRQLRIVQVLTIYTPDWVVK